jgi:dipeptidyl aminopeptidase/acylaminoacyl peptidase
VSTYRGALARPYPNGVPRILAFVAIPLLVGSLAIGVVSAELPPSVTRLSAADAERAGATIRVARRLVHDSTLVEVDPQATRLTLLAISADGTQAALADQVGESSGSLVLAAADGSQLRIQLPGLIGAGFAADAAWLAVVDARGALWRVESGSGRSELLAPGPFIGSPTVDEDGSVLVLGVSSVEAPYRSMLVRLTPATGVATPVGDEELVYGAFPLEDGAIAIVAHERGSTVVHRLADGDDRSLVDLGPGAINAAVAPDGRRVAFERDGAGIFLLDMAGSAPQRVGAGSRPCFSADGSALLVRRGDESVVLAADGSLLTVASELSAFAGSAGCLP